MVLCKFFQQGNCRYGDTCRFEHSLSRFEDTSVVSPLLRASQQNAVPAPAQAVHHNQHHVFGSRQQPHSQHVFPSRSQTSEQNVFGGRPANNPSDIREIYSILVQELNVSERSGQWPLSCFNPLPLRVHGNIPGLEDHSPDELRCLLYEARVTGGLDSCKQQIQLLYQQAQARRNVLRNATAETFSMLEALMRGPPPSLQQFPHSLSGSVAHDSWPTTNSSPQPSAFGSPSGGGPSVFGVGGSGQQLSFGASSGNTQPAPVFGGANQPPPSSSTSIFGGSSSNQTSVFGNSSDAPFGANIPPNQSIFGGSAPQTSFNLPGQGNMFASPAAGASNFTFKLPDQSGSVPGAVNSPFGVPTASSQNVFGASGNEQKTNSFTGFQPIPAAQPVFNSNGNTVLNSTLGVSDASLHTELSALTQDEKDEFTAATFTVGRIPVCPPPKEMCN